MSVLDAGFSVDIALIDISVLTDYLLFRAEMLKSATKGGGKRNYNDSERVMSLADMPDAI